MISKPTVSDAELRERYLKLYSGAVNDILRFDYKMHAALPSEYQPLNRDMKLCGRAFTIKGAPDITTDGEFAMRAEMLEALPPESIVMWDCTGDTDTAQWGDAAFYFSQILDPAQFQGGSVTILGQAFPLDSLVPAAWAPLPPGRRSRQ